MVPMHAWRNAGKTQGAKMVAVSLGSEVLWRVESRLLHEFRIFTQFVYVNGFWGLFFFFFWHTGA